MTQEKYDIEGMSCSACSSHVEKCVSELNGVQKVQVNLLTNSMDVTYDEKNLAQDQIIAAVVKAGYGASQHGVNTKKEEDSYKEQMRHMRHRLVLSVVFLIPLMYLAMYSMFEKWFGLPIPAFVLKAFHGEQNVIAYTLTQLLLVLPIIYVNRTYYLKGFRALLRGSPNMDSLIAIGSSCAAIYGVFAIYRIGWGLGYSRLDVVMNYKDALYFESAGMILTLVTLGKYLEEKSKGRTKKAITKLMDLSPKTAVVDRFGQEITIPTEEVQIGDIFILRPGSIVPVDGMILEGTSGVDEAAISGESIPVDKKPGDRVVTASINKSGFLRCKATEVGENTTLATIIKLVEEASASKAPISRLADKIAGIFVPVVILIALVTFAAWYGRDAEFEFALTRAIAVLVISCPCALGLATPVAIMVGTGVGARNGILIKSGEVLQLAQELNAVVLDKTGTITEGKLRVTDVISYSESITRDELLKIASTLERGSEHPISKAIVEEALLGGTDEYELKQFKSEFGKGVSGSVAEKGMFYLGNLLLMQIHRVKVEDAQLHCMEELAQEGKTPLLLGDEKQIIGIIGVSDTIKPSSRQAIIELNRMGIETIMLTGDNIRTAEAVARQLGQIEVVADVLPADKERKIADLRAQGKKVAMVGDGVNDAPALAAADVGIAIGAGTDVAIESADIILMHNTLEDVAMAIRLSKSVIRNIKENLFWAFFYNTIGIPIAAGLLYAPFGLELNPMFGAMAMSLSSILVVGNALRLTGFEKKKKEKKNVVERNEIMEKTITIEGMMCDHCKQHVEEALLKLDGVTKVTVSLEKKSAVIMSDKNLSDEVIKEAISEAGYKAL